MILHEPPYEGLKKVISGGQCGADLGGISAAHEFGVPTGGIAPLGYRTQWGNNPSLGAIFGLTEDASSKYPPRTRKNVAQSDGTLIIATNMASPGCTLTYNLCFELRKPVYQFVPLPDYNQAETPALFENVVEWVIKHRIEVLNVAGNRDNRYDNLHFKATFKLVTAVLHDLKKRNLINDHQ
jgi:hypothetical protein